MQPGDINKSQAAGITPKQHETSEKSPRLQKLDKLASKIGDLFKKELSHEGAAHLQGTTMTFSCSSDLFQTTKEVSSPSFISSAPQTVGRVNQIISEEEEVVDVDALLEQEVISKASDALDQMFEEEEAKEMSTVLDQALEIAEDWQKTSQVETKFSGNERTVSWVRAKPDSKITLLFSEISPFLDRVKNLKSINKQEIDKVFREFSGNERYQIMPKLKNIEEQMKSTPPTIKDKFKDDFSLINKIINLYR